MSNKASVFQRVVASVLCVTLTITSTAIVAQPHLDPSVMGREGQTFGNELLGNFMSSGQGSLSGNALSLPGTESPLNINDLYPGTSSENAEAPIKFFPDDYTTDVDYYRGVHDSGRAMDDGGYAAQGILWDDASKEDPQTLQGQAYKVLLDMTNRSRPDLRNDPIFRQSREVLDDLGDWQEQFGDCTTETSYRNEGRTVHVPEYERCERVVDKSAECEIVHDYEAAVVRHHSGPFNLDSCGDGCTSLWIGRIGDNYWSGWCSIYEQSTTVTVVNPDAITSAVLEYVKWDDYMQVWVGELGKERKVWQGPNSNFPPETPGECELTTSWSSSPGVDVTNYFKNVEPGGIVNFKIRVSVSGEGEGYGRIRIRYDPRKAITKDEWIPQHCLDAAIAVDDGFASGSFECTDDPSAPPTCHRNEDGTYSCDRIPEGWTPGMPWEGCVYINGVKVCEDYLSPSPIEGIPRMCRKVSVVSDYDFYKGRMDCYTDINGELQCPENEGGNLNSCTVYEDDPQCGYIKSECVEGAQGDSGECYVFEDTYDCGYSVELDTIEKDVEIQCTGPIRCMGTDCLDISYSQNNDFAKASALLNAAQFMAQDMACSGYDDEGNPTGDDNVICSVFPGEGGECKKAVGGIVNCCEKPDGIGFGDYITALMTIPKIDTAIMGLSDGNSIRSAYQVLRDPITQGWSEVTKPFASFADNISGVKETVSQTVDSLISDLQSMVADVFQDTMGAAAEDAIGQKIAEIQAEAAANQFMEQVGAMVNFIGTVYTIYNVAMLAIKMIFKCTESEMELNVKRQLRSCHYVGSYCKTEVLGVCIEKRESYCCFSSPLSRIIQQQTRPQLGLGWGSAKRPSCGGLSMEQIAQIDWERVNLDEWLGILQSTGNWPDMHNIDINTLTGAGSTFDLGSRVDAEQRALDRFEDTDVDQTRYDLSITHNPFTGEAMAP